MLLEELTRTNVSAENPSLYHLARFTILEIKVKVKVYTGSHQRTLRKGSQLVLALARASPIDEKEKQQRLMRIRRVVSHAIRPAPSPPEASRSTSTPPSRSPIITVAVVKVYFVSCFCDLV